jgi:hypothetical protein
MILALLTLDSPKHVKAFDAFLDLIHKRYASFLSQPLEPVGNHTRFSAVKPYHSEAFPFLALDMLVHFRNQPCQLFFGHDMLTLNGSESVRVLPGGALSESVASVLKDSPKGQPCLRFQGFGPRIDLALNALATLYVDLLSSLTKVEAEVIEQLRTLQYEKYNCPISVKTFGLQKQVAAKLGKSPVAIHKSLRSAKFDLVSDTASAMKQIMG